MIGANRPIIPNQHRKEESDMIRKLLGGGLIALLALTTACSSSTPKPEVHLEEDDPGWDCHTMGNRTCGENPPSTARKVPAGTICWNSAMTLNCTFPPGCWEEDNPTQPYGKEVICDYQE